MPPLDVSYLKPYYQGAHEGSKSNSLLFLVTFFLHLISTRASIVKICSMINQKKNSKVTKNIPDDRFIQLHILFSINLIISVSSSVVRAS